MSQQQRFKVSATGDCFELNRIGARIWQCLVRGEDLDRAVDAIAADHAVDRSLVSADTVRLVDELARRGILVVAP